MVVSDQDRLNRRNKTSKIGKIFAENILIKTSLQ